MNTDELHGVLVALQGREQVQEAGMLTTGRA